MLSSKLIKVLLSLIIFVLILEAIYYFYLSSSPKPTAIVSVPTPTQTPTQVPLVEGLQPGIEKIEYQNGDQSLKLSGIVSSEVQLDGNKYSLIISSAYKQQEAEVRIFLGDKDVFNRVGFSSGSVKNKESVEESWVTLPIEEVARRLKKGDQVIIYILLTYTDITSGQSCLDQCKNRKTQLEQHLLVNQTFLDSPGLFQSALKELGPVSQIRVESGI